MKKNIFLNDFHKSQTEAKQNQIERWKKQPLTLEEAKRQRERLRMQRAIREE